MCGGGQRKSRRMRVYFSTPMGEKVSVEVDECATVAELREAIVDENVRLEKRTLPEDEMQIPDRTRVVPGTDIDIYFGPLRMEPGRRLLEYYMREEDEEEEEEDRKDDGDSGGGESRTRTKREIVVHPRWIPVHVRERVAENGSQYLASREDSQKALHIVGSLAILDPDFWLECWQSASEGSKERWEEVKRQLGSGYGWQPIKAAFDRSFSSPFWPGDYAHREAQSRTQEQQRQQWRWT